MTKCAICREPYTKWRITQKVCGKVECAQAFAERVREKQERKELRAKLEKLKTRRDYMKEAQIAFNAYIRERDAGLPCICCDKPLGNDDIGGRYDCGHFRSVGSAPHLRFDERNANAQRKQCNRWGAGRAVDYRIGLIRRIGLEAVESLESDQTEKHYTAQELIEIRNLYRKKLKELKNA